MDELEEVKSWIEEKEKELKKRVDIKSVFYSSQLLANNQYKKSFEMLKNRRMVEI